ncbi:MAG: hypothetical protein EOO09_14745 [Chitinophagaceae bacterium]|nr:MAG: hypothetical protein EOO09_14745 [Chitinophagaceae bacterium]
MGLSNLGIFHTVIGVIAIVAALTGFIRNGKIDPGTISGKTYLFTTLITSFTALGISKHGGFNPGHMLSLLIVVLVGAAWLLHLRVKKAGKARYFENFFLSFSFFLSMLPTVNETLTRFPVGHPLAKDISDPLIGKVLLVILVLFVTGSIYQFGKQRKLNLLAPATT